MRKTFAMVLLAGLTLSASAAGTVRDADPQKLHFNLGLLPGEAGYFYCDVQPTVSHVSLSSNVTVNGFIDGSITITGTSKISQVLNQVYFTATYQPFSGSLPSIDVEYEGSQGGMTCYEGKGNRTIEYSGQ
jgi:hypothetical protein